MNKEKFLILGDIDIQPLISMQKALTGILCDAKGKKDEVYRTYQMAAVQAFEVSYEAAWKICQKVLKKYALNFHYSKDVFRESAKISLLNDPEPWFEFLEIRNETTHTYDSDILTEIFSIIPKFLVELERLIENLKSFSNKEV
jgi:nucleotidyltransferase substrate binding protein (TIGR01987 family)